MEETSKITYTSTVVHMGPVSKDLSQQSAKKNHKLISASG